MRLIIHNNHVQKFGVLSSSTLNLKLDRFIPHLGEIKTFLNSQRKNNGVINLKRGFVGLSVVVS